MITFICAFPRSDLYWLNFDQFVFFKYVCLKDIFVKIRDFLSKQNKDKQKIFTHRQQKAKLKSKVKLKYKLICHPEIDENKVKQGIREKWTKNRKITI